VRLAFEEKGAAYKLHDVSVLRGEVSLTASAPTVSGDQSGVTRQFSFEISRK
jgi:hypothetical protein